MPDSHLCAALDHGKIATSCGSHATARPRRLHFGANSTEIEMLGRGETHVGLRIRARALDPKARANAGYECFEFQTI